MLPPEPNELMALIYSCAELPASEDIEKCKDETGSGASAVT
jgi:hypothetical protein